MEVVVGLVDDNRRLYDKSFRKLHANSLKMFGQMNIDLHLLALRSPFWGDGTQWRGNGKEGKSWKGGSHEWLAYHPTGYCFAFHNGRNNQAATSSTSVISPTSPIRCQIAQKQSLPLVGEMLLAKRGQAYVLDQRFWRYVWPRPLDMELVLVAIGCKSHGLRVGRHTTSHSIVLSFILWEVICKENN